MKRIIKAVLPLTLSFAILGGCNKLNSELEDLRNSLETVDGKIKSLSERLDAIENTHLKNLETQIASVKTDIALLQSSDNVQTEAIEALESKMSEISEELAKVKTTVSALEDKDGEFSDKIESINTRLAGLSSEIASLESIVGDLKEKMEGEVSVELSYIPKYTDHKEYVLYKRSELYISNGTTLMFDIQPRSAADSIAKNWQSTLTARAMYAHTKPVDNAFVCLDIIGASAEGGVLSVTVSADKLGNDFITDNGASVAIKVNSERFIGLSDYVELTPEFESTEEKERIIYLLKTFDVDGDGQPDDMDKVTELNVSGFGLSASIDNILAAMTALKTLNCSNNNLTSIDLSHNTALESLDVSNNVSLAALDVSKTVKLTVSKGQKPSIYKIGQYVSIDGNTGIVYQTSSPAIVSTDESSKPWDYYGTSTGATSSDDGVANTDKIASGSSAAKWCRDKGSEWYLPALNELKVIYNNKSTLNATLSSIGGTQFGTGNYQSSTEHTVEVAYSINFSSGTENPNFTKRNSFNVRAVRAL